MTDQGLMFTGNPPSDMKATPRHREISQQLMAEIAEGKFSASSRLPSEAQLVARFQVSRPTVIRALRNLQEDGVVERRVGSGTYLRRSGGKEAASRKLGLLVPERGTTEIFELICGELAGLARAEDFLLLWGVVTPLQQQQNLSTDEAFRLCEQFIEQRVAGVFFAPFEHLEEPDTINRQITERLSSAGIPLVLLDRDAVMFPSRSQFDLVGVDNFAASYLLAEHLIKLGCQRIAFVMRPGSAPTVYFRQAGLREALLNHALETPPDLVQVGDPTDNGFVRLLAAGQRWDAVMCANDLTAAHLMATLAKNHVRVPQDLRVVGFDDARYATLLGTPLTTMHQPCRDIAVTAFQALRERMAEPALPPRKLLLSAHLVVRESCGAYLASS
jgi:DNA-binding LacI/PurR family transcriptional regulator